MVEQKYDVVIVGGSFGGCVAGKVAAEKGLNALIIERASGQSYAEFVEKRLFAPLGMASSVVFDERAPRIAKRWVKVVPSLPIRR